MSQREILFKAKRTDDGEWVEGNYVSKTDPLLGVEKSFILNQTELSSLCHWYQVDRQTVCQYTGLTDKNGKKIFEGDILKYKDDYTNETKCEAKFNRCSFMAVWQNDWDAETLDNGFHMYSEVIGNIHDN